MKHDVQLLKMKVKRPDKQEVKYVSVEVLQNSSNKDVKNLEIRCRLETLESLKL